MDQNEKRSGRDEVLLACLNLEKKGFKEFTEWQITIEAWTINTNRFGLRGFEDLHPDHKRVHESYVGRQWTEGILERVRENIYRLTAAGRKMALSVSGESDLRRKADISLLNDLQRYSNHGAFKKFKANKESDINWNQASSFYGTNWKLPPSKNRSKIKTLLKTLEESEKLINEKGPDVLRRNINEKPVSLGTIKNLKKLHDYIQSKFKREFDALVESEDY